MVCWGVNFHACGAICHFIFGQHLLKEESCAVVLVIDGNDWEFRAMPGFADHTDLVLGVASKVCGHFSLEL